MIYYNSESKVIINLKKKWEDKIMLVIKSIEIMELENAGCNNGNYPEYTVFFTNGEKYTGMTCRCLSGCSGTDCIRDLETGMGFDSIEDFENFIES